MNTSNFVLRGQEQSRESEATLFGKITENITIYANKKALICSGRAVTYAELGRHAFLVRDALLTAGVREGQLIGIVTRGRSPMIAAMLGVWTTGCAFVPLAGDQPSARRDNALDQIGSNIVLVDTHADVISGYCCVVLSELLSTPSAPKTLSQVKTHPTSVAYGFFTSGSTGAPKCCLNAHSGLNNRAEAMSRLFDLKPGQTVLQNSSHVFDSSLWQIFWPLSVGGTVVIPDRHGILDFHNTLDDIAEHRVVMTDFVPTILDQLIETVRRDSTLRFKMDHLKYLLVGGEAITPKLVTDFISIFPKTQLVNTYGPTEASIGMVFHHFTGEETEIPLGLPIDNTALCIVDADLNPMPFGERGEIIIGGACIGLGYLGDLRKTSEVFIEGSNFSLGSEIVYRTGDIGHIGKDRLLYFDGRSDEQIKINGVRIEIGDIEAHLSNVPHVQWCKVTKVTTEGRNWLAGFFIADQTLCSKALKADLSMVLDPASIPSLLVQIDDIPTMASGKVDVMSLVRRYCTVKTSTVLASADNTKEKILSACRMLLLGSEVKEEDDLISLGLDSLGAVKLALRISDILGRQFTLSDIMSAPTVAEICAGSWEKLADHASVIRQDIEALSILPNAPTSDATKKGVLLTGATGYVGRHVLLNLLETTDHEITCPVRASNLQHALVRLCNELPDLEPVILRRIKPVLADFSTGSFSYQEFGNPTAVIHVAADVNFSKKYRQLRKANVEAVAQLCNFSKMNGARFIHISSIAALANGAILPNANTNQLPRPTVNCLLPLTGYGQSKWAAEQIVMAYRDQGLCADIYRLGEMMPDQRVPDANARSVFTILCHAATKVRCIPEFDEITDFTPMSIVMQVLTHRCTMQDTPDQTLNLISPQPIQLTQMFRAVLPQLPMVSQADFQKKLQILNKGSDNEDTTRALLLIDAMGCDSDTPHFQCPKLLAHLGQLNRSGIVWPDISEQTLVEMLSKMRTELRTLTLKQFESNIESEKV